MTEVPGSPWGEVLPEPSYPAPGDWRHRGQVVHVFTHFRLELEVWSATVQANGLHGGWWTAPADLRNEALPTLFRKVLAGAGLVDA
jgi:A/G-specific adenine glycosylase